MILLALALAMQVAGMPPERVKAIAARYHATQALEECAVRRADGMIGQPDTAETLSRAAILLCGEQEEHFRQATFESMRWLPEPRQRPEGEAWIAQVNEAVRQDVISYIVFTRSPPTSPAPH